MIKMIDIAIILMLVVFAICCLSGCSVQTQKDITYKDGKMIHHAEAFSGRLCWMSNGIELYDKTPYWELGANVSASKTDPNSIEAAGTAVGNVVGASAMGIIK
jgi:hypothetical protein